MWKNNNYVSFDHFLEFFSSRNRKNLKKERRKIIEQNIEIRRFSGNQISSDLVDDFYSFYVDTHLKRSGHSGYLNKDFFKQITNAIPDNILMVLAYKDSRAVAGSFFFYDQNNLLSFSHALEKASNSKKTEVNVEQISLDQRIKLLLKFVNN